MNFVLVKIGTNEICFGGKGGKVLKNNSEDPNSFFKLCISSGNLYEIFLLRERIHKLNLRLQYN